MPKTKRKRGGQPGNKNALQHGLWANRIHKNEKTRIRNLPVTNIEGEIGYLKTVAARLALSIEKNGLSYKSTGLPSEDLIKTIYVLDTTMTRLLTYIRTHALLVGDMTEFERDVEEGKRLARLDMNVYDYFTYAEFTDETSQEDL